MTDSTEPRTEGLKLVHASEMTEEMMDAGKRYLDNCVRSISPHGFNLPALFNWHEFWGEILKASPRPTTDTVEREKISSATYRALLSLEYDGVEPAISKQQAWHAVRDAIRALPSAAGGETPRTAPESCPHCHDESDCSSVDICRAVDDLYPPTSAAGGEVEAFLKAVSEAKVVTNAAANANTIWTLRTGAKNLLHRAALQQEPPNDHHKPERTPAHERGNSTGCQEH